ncbi:hypothetical protein ACQKIY_25520 [Bacillus mycoides]|uniref:hypothetical protein n=1 Tax=Bacillus mycoides TaxID=1405 RepID=UPI003CFE2AD5
MTKKLKAMPYALKQKLRQLDNYSKRIARLNHEIIDMVEEHGVPYDNLVANVDIYRNELQTEALAYINNAEGDVEVNIKDIEEVFLHYANKED